MGAGRPPKPTALKIAQGHPGHRPLNHFEPKPDVGIPEMPKKLSKGARRAFKRYVPVLQKLGILTVVDGEALAGACECAARLEQVRDELARTGLTYIEHFQDRNGEIVMGNIKANPLVAMENAYYKTLKSWLVEFGLTPSSRSKLHAVPAGSEVDVAEEFLSGTGTHGLAVVK